MVAVAGAIAVFYGRGGKVQVSPSGLTSLEERRGWRGGFGWWGQTGAPLSLCRYSQLLYITGEKTTHFISPWLPPPTAPQPPLLPLSFIPLALLSQALFFFSPLLLSQFLQHTHTQAHPVYIFPRHPSPHSVPPQRNSFQLCVLLKKPLYAELT